MFCAFGEWVILLTARYGFLYVQSSIISDCETNAFETVPPYECERRRCACGQGEQDSSFFFRPLTRPLSWPIENPLHPQNVDGERGGGKGSAAWPLGCLACSGLQGTRLGYGCLWLADASKRLADARTGLVLTMSLGLEYCGRSWAFDSPGIVCNIKAAEHFGALFYLPQRAIIVSVALLARTAAPSDAMIPRRQDVASSFPTL